MTYILIVMWALNSGASTGTFGVSMQEFANSNRCEEAAEQIKVQAGMPSPKQLQVFCIPKGK